MPWLKQRSLAKVQIPKTALTPAFRLGKKHGTNNRALALKNK